MHVAIFTIAALAAILVMASGVWVATVLMAVVARRKQPAESATQRAA